MGRGTLHRAGDRLGYSSATQPAALTGAVRVCSCLHFPCSIPGSPRGLGSKSAGGKETGYEGRPVSSLSCRLSKPFPSCHGAVALTSWLFLCLPLGCAASGLQSLAPHGPRQCRALGAFHVPRLPRSGLQRLWALGPGMSLSNVPSWCQRFTPHGASAWQSVLPVCPVLGRAAR